MLNHARTLLLNRDGGDAASAPGEQAVPRDYRALTLPPALRAVRARLFGADPDRATLNYRLHQYMALLGATDLDEYVRRLDPRISYRSGGSALFLPATFAPRQDGESALTVIGTPRDITADGRSWHDYALARDGGGFRVVQHAPYAMTMTVSPDVTDGLSAPIPLGVSGYSVLALDTDAGPWRIGMYIRPRRSLTAILAGLLSFGEDVLDVVLGRDALEPLATFRALVRTSPDMSLVLGGLLLATVWRTEEVRRG